MTPEASSGLMRRILRRIERKRHPRHRLREALRFHQDTEGQAMAEFCVILPVLLFLILGIIQMMLIANASYLLNLANFYALRTGVSVLGMLDGNAEDTSVEAETEVSIKLIAQMGPLAGAIARLRQGQKPIAPDPSLSLSGNFLYTMTGQKPDADYERIMDVSLILHADHGMNASTFTSMVVNSSLSDMYSSITAGIGSLKGPLHGGANERVPITSTRGSPKRGRPSAG